MPLLLVRVFRYQYFSQTQKGSPAKYSRTVRQKYSRTSGTRNFQKQLDTPPTTFVLTDKKLPKPFVGPHFLVHQSFCSEHVGRARTFWKHEKLQEVAKGSLTNFWLLWYYETKVSHSFWWYDLAKDSSRTDKQRRPWRVLRLFFSSGPYFFERANSHFSYAVFFSKICECPSDFVLQIQ